jgi:hypothetical protein
VARGWGRPSAIFADPIARDLGISINWFFAAYSGSLVISRLLGPRVGRRIDRVGGRQVLSGSNVILAGGLALLGASTTVWMIGMGLGLYDAARRSALSGASNRSQILYRVILEAWMIPRTRGFRTLAGAGPRLACW